MRLAGAILTGALALGAIPAWGAEHKSPLLPTLEVGGQVFARVEVGDADGFTRTFSLPSARLSLDARWKDLLRATVEADAADARVLKDAFIDVQVLRFASVRAGRFKAPFSLRQMTSRWKLEEIERGLVNAAASDRGFAGRRLGLELRLTRGSFAGLTLAAFQGASGAAEDLAARATAKPSRFLSLGVGGYARAHGAQGAAFGADARVKVRAYRFRAEALSLSPDGPGLGRPLGASAVLSRRFGLGEDLELTPLIGGEWLQVPSGSETLAASFGPAPGGTSPWAGRAVLVGANLTARGALRLQVQLARGQLEPSEAPRLRVTAQLGAHF